MTHPKISDELKDVLTSAHPSCKDITHIRFISVSFYKSAISDGNIETIQLPFNSSLSRKSVCILIAND